MQEFANDLILFGITLPIAIFIAGATIGRLTETEAQRRQRRRDKLRRQNEQALRRDLQRFFQSRR